MIETQSTDHPKNWDSLINYSRGLPEFSRFVLSTEQMAYLLYWNRCLMPFMKPDSSRCCYLAMGPDLSTPLLALNPSTIEGIDICEWKITMLQHNLKMAGSRHKASLPEFAAIEAQQRRKREGFWNCDEFSRLGGWYKPLIIELMSLGVNPLNVQCAQTASHKIEISFDWQHPFDKISRKRQIVFNHGMSLGAFIDKNCNPFDYYLDKGVNIEKFGKRSGGLSVGNLLTTNGIIISSTEYDGKLNKDGDYSTTLQKIFGEQNSLNLENIPIPEAAIINREMKQRYAKFGWGYGWKLHGFRINQVKYN